MIALLWLIPSNQWAFPFQSATSMWKVRVSEFALQKENKHLRESHLHLLLGIVFDRRKGSFQIIVQRDRPR